MRQLEVNNINHFYGKVGTVRNFNLTLEKGSIGCLLGPSGCGKTTALRCIAGFEKISSGSIHIGEKIVNDPQRNIYIPPEQRNTGIVFQDHALFPHLTVEQNIAFGLKSQKQKRIREMLALVNLENYRKRYPHELSGGQRQRIALARALAADPAIVLLDEPFASLDNELREKLKIEVRSILKRTNSTALLVTHDQKEAFDLADEIGVMENGEILQWGRAEDLYRSPTSPFVASFIGQGNFIKGDIISENPLLIQTKLGTIKGIRAEKKTAFRQADSVSGENSEELNQEEPGEKNKGEGFIYIRPEHIQINSLQRTDGTSQALAEHNFFRGNHSVIKLRLDDGQVLFANHHSEVHGQVDLSLVDTEKTFYVYQKNEVLPYIET